MGEAGAFYVYREWEGGEKERLRKWECPNRWDWICFQECPSAMEADLMGGGSKEKTAPTGGGTETCRRVDGSPRRCFGKNQQEKGDNVTCFLVED